MLGGGAGSAGGAAPPHNARAGRGGGGRRRRLGGGRDAHLQCRRGARGGRMATPVFEQINYAVADGVARLTLNRPEKLNAISPGMLREIHDALWEADDDTAVHCVVLAGA